MRNLVVLVALLACKTEDVEPVFPADYAYTEVRDCRASADHDLNKIRILADAASLGPYRDRDAPFPEGAIILKEEFDFADGDCTGPVIQWTVMQRVADDWYWQKVSANRTVVSEDEPRCINCHAACGGYLGTCAVP